MPRLPRKMRMSQSPFGVEWNAMCDYLASLKPIDGPNVHTDHTPFGVARKAYGRGAASQPGVGGNLEITVCDPATGTEKIYRVVGTDVTPT